MSELNLRFADKDHVTVVFGDEDSGALAFKDPLTPKDRKDLQWYLETYGAHSLGDPDDGEARRIAALLPVLGKALFNAVFSDRASQRLFNDFQDATDETRLLTISAESPAILGLPWELLCDPARGGIFLFNENPRISIRRVVSGKSGGRKPFKVQPKERLHLLFVVSRPEGSGFLDPRADPCAVLDALETHAPGRFTWEFLRPPTLDALIRRVEDKDKPPVDILHFDGHGVFDAHGGLPERLRAKKIKLEEAFAGVVVKDKKQEAPSESPPNIGYLLFEEADGQPHLVPSELLGFNLHRRKIPLVILSACQSATQGNNDEPLGSVAARLTAAGIPAVVAMTYSVLVATTRNLFGEFYRQLASRSAIGEALDAARLHLHNHPEKYEVQRGPNREWLKLYDWFVPALYQSDADMLLIFEGEVDGTTAQPKPATPRNNVPNRPESGFFGRKHELWEIERGFADKARRITLTGFGGQGKTALAHEAARWLMRTGMFEAAAFVDYSRVQAEDALSVAIGQIGSVLGHSLIDASAVRTALEGTPTLVILDNLETVSAGPLRELLDAANGWSEAGRSRVLLTTRTPDFGHPAYGVVGTHIHHRILLAGLGSRKAPDDALEWFAALSKLPPAPTEIMPNREALISHFDMVRFHPLSIRAVAQELKTRRSAEVGRRLEELLADSGDGAPASSSTEATLPELVAALKLSLDRLDAAARQALPRLGVFQGGAFEDDLMVITTLGDPYENRRAGLQSQLRSLEEDSPRAFARSAGIDLPDDIDLPPELIDKLRQATDEIRKELAQIPATPTGANVWPDLRRQLEAAALLEAESVPGVGPPFLRFHPTLAPMLWEQLAPDERDRLTTAHSQRYAGMAAYLYHEDTKNPHFARAIALRELPNLLRAVHAAFDDHDPEAVDFADSVSRFLNSFGLKREANRLMARAQAASREEGSQEWFLARSSHGEQLLSAGQVAEAARVFETILARSGDAPSYKRAQLLGQLGRCFMMSGRTDLAAARHREGIAVTKELEQSDGVKGLLGVLNADLGNALAVIGDIPGARSAYETSLSIKRERGDVRGEGVTLGQLGALALREGDLNQALMRYQALLAHFQKLREPASEAVAWHQLGLVFQRAGQLGEAERHYREAARLHEENGSIAGTNGAATSWMQLANVSTLAGKPEAAEGWYQKAIASFRNSGDQSNLSRCLSNLAYALGTQPDRLREARQLAEEALALKPALHPGVAEIWKTHGLLAEIANREAAITADSRRQAELRVQSRDHWRLAREAKRNYAGTRHELRKHLPLILATFLAAQNSAEQEKLDAVLKRYSDPSWNRLVSALRRIGGGERDPDLLCVDLDPEDSMIVETILAVLSDPSTLSDLMPTDPPEA